MDKPMVFGSYRICTGYDGRPLESKRSALGVLTYTAEDSSSQEPVVLKIIPATSFESERLERLQKHVEQARVLQHPNIAKVLHFERFEDDYVYVQECVEGETAASWVKERGPMPVDIALRIGLQVAQALSAAAFHLSPHCAISPRNLVLASGRTPTGEWPFIKVINFGLAEIEFAEAAKQNGARLQHDASIFYRSPEQAQRRNVDIRSDIYSLGCTLWFLLAGAPPFVAEDSPLLAPAVMTEPPVEELKRLPKSMRSLLAYMLRRDPEERPLDPVALIQVIERSLARVERRQRLARRVGMPFLAPAYAMKIKPAELEEKRPARPARWLVRTAAAGALAILLGALVAFGISHLGKKSIFNNMLREKPIGVPIGVTEPTVASPIAKNPIAENKPAKGPEVKHTIAKATQTPAVAAMPSQTSGVATKATQTPPAVAKATDTPPIVAAENAQQSHTQSSVQAAESSATPSAAMSQMPSMSVTSPDATDIPLSGLASNQAASRDNAGPENPAGNVAPPSTATDQLAAPEAAPAQETEPSPPVVTKNENASSNEVGTDAKDSSASATQGSGTRSTASKRTASHRTKKRHEVRRALPPDVETVSSTRASRVIRARFLGATPDGNWILGIGGSHETMIVPPPPPQVARSVLANGVHIALPADY